MYVNSISASAIDFSQRSSLPERKLFIAPASCPTSPLLHERIDSQQKIYERPFSADLQTALDGIINHQCIIKDWFSFSVKELLQECQQFFETGSLTDQSYEITKGVLGSAAMGLIRKGECGDIDVFFICTLPISLEDITRASERTHRLLNAMRDHFETIVRKIYYRKYQEKHQASSPFLSLKEVWWHFVTKKFYKNDPIQLGKNGNRFGVMRFGKELEVKYRIDYRLPDGSVLSGVEFPCVFIQDDFSIVIDYEGRGLVMRSQENDIRRVISDIASQQLCTDCHKPDAFPSYLEKVTLRAGRTTLRSLSEAYQLAKQSYGIQEMIHRLYARLQERDPLDVICVLTNIYLLSPQDTELVSFLEKKLEKYFSGSTHPFSWLIPLFMLSSKLYNSDFIKMDKYTLVRPDQCLQRCLCVVQQKVMPVRSPFLSLQFDTFDDFVKALWMDVKPYLSQMELRTFAHHILLFHPLLFDQLLLQHFLSQTQYLGVSTVTQTVLDSTVFDPACVVKAHDASFYRACLKVDRPLTIEQIGLLFSQAMTQELGAFDRRMIIRNIRVRLREHLSESAQEEFRLAVSQDTYSLLDVIRRLVNSSDSNLQKCVSILGEKLLQDPSQWNDEILPCLLPIFSHLEVTHLVSLLAWQRNHSAASLDLAFLFYPLRGCDQFLVLMAEVLQWSSTNFLDMQEAVFHFCQNATAIQRGTFLKQVLKHCPTLVVTWGVKEFIVQMTSTMGYKKFFKYASRWQSCGLSSHDFVGALLSCIQTIPDQERWQAYPCLWLHKDMQNYLHDATIVQFYQRAMILALDKENLWSLHMMYQLALSTQPLGEAQESFVSLVMALEDKKEFVDKKDVAEKLAYILSKHVMLEPACASIFINYCMRHSHLFVAQKLLLQWVKNNEIDRPLLFCFIEQILGQASFNERELGFFSEICSEFLKVLLRTNAIVDFCKLLKILKTSHFNTEVKQGLCQALSQQLVSTHPWKKIVISYFSA